IVKDIADTLDILAVDREHVGHETILQLMKLCFQLSKPQQAKEIADYFGITRERYLYDIIEDYLEPQLQRNLLDPVGIKKFCQAFDVTAEELGIEPEDKGDVKNYRISKIPAKLSDSIMPPAYKYRLFKDPKFSGLKILSEAEVAEQIRIHKQNEDKKRDDSWGIKHSPLTRYGTNVDRMLVETLQSLPAIRLLDVGAFTGQQWLDEGPELGITYLEHPRIQVLLSSLTDLFDYGTRDYFDANGNSILILGDVDSLQNKLKIEDYDIIVCHYGAHFQELAFIDLAFKALKKGGSLYLTSSDHFSGISAEDIRVVLFENLSSGTFICEQLETISPVADSLQPKDFRERVWTIKLTKIADFGYSFIDSKKYQDIEALNDTSNIPFAISTTNNSLQRAIYALKAEVINANKNRTLGLSVNHNNIDKRSQTAISEAAKQLQSIGVEFSIVSNIETSGNKIIISANGNHFINQEARRLAKIGISLVYNPKANALSNTIAQFNLIAAGNKEISLSDFQILALSANTTTANSTISYFHERHGHGFFEKVRLQNERSLFHGSIKVNGERFSTEELPVTLETLLKLTQTVYQGRADIDYLNTAFPLLEGTFNQLQTYLAQADVALNALLSENDNQQVFVVENEKRFIVLLRQGENEVEMDLGPKDEMDLSTVVKQTSEEWQGFDHEATKLWEIDKSAPNVNKYLLKIDLHLQMLAGYTSQARSQLENESSLLNQLTLLRASIQAELERRIKATQTFDARIREEALSQISGIDPVLHFERQLEIQLFEFYRLLKNVTEFGREFYFLKNYDLSAILNFINKGVTNVVTTTITKIAL
ncbi:MAG: class I SAM-dependent methyltransferase, partial [Proteobacteria bacterium]|nr:class I SAM-dependent methyltransferase [Pseudomonadota bacterium]